MGADLHLYLIDPGEQGQQGLFRFRFERPLAVTGLYKLVNRFLLMVFTPKGSHPTQPGRGTRYPYLLGQVNISDMQAVQVDILDSLQDATDQLLALDRANTTLTQDERLKSATMSSFSVTSETGGEFSVDILNRANQRARILVPYAPLVG